MIVSFCKSKSPKIILRFEIVPNSSVDKILYFKILFLDKEKSTKGPLVITEKLF